MVAALAVAVDGFINRHGGDLGWFWTLAFLACLAVVVVDR